MKIVLPESIADITLGQFQEYNLVLNNDDLTDKQKQDKKVCIFAGIHKSHIKDISSKDYTDIVKQIDFALGQDVVFESSFFIDETEFGFIPNFDKITQGEFIDLESYRVDVENLHKVMAVLFRPITDKDKFGNYEIMNYKGTDRYSELMKQMPLSIVNGALVFFLNLSKELENYIQKSMQEEQVRVK